jgi:hypothetical protein
LGNIRKLTSIDVFIGTWLVNMGFMEKKLIKLLEDNVVTAGEYGCCRIAK